MTSLVVRLTEAQAELDRSSIETIHAFAASLLRRRPVEAGVDPRFSIADAQTQRRLLEEEWSRHVARRAETEDEPLSRLLLAGVKIDPLRALARSFVEHRDVALAGSPARTSPPDPLSFARDLRDWMAAGVEMTRAGCPFPQDLLRAGLEKALDQAREIAALDAKKAHGRLLRDAPIKINKSWGKSSHWRSGALEQARQQAESWKQRFGDYRRALEEHLAGEAAFWIGGFVKAYQDFKKDEGILDFQDLLIHARDLLRNPRVAEEFRRAFPFLLVDEFQDTDPLQVEIVALLAGRGEGGHWTSRRPEGGSLFIVGDPKQSIYRFRRADIAVYEKARKWIQETCGDESVRTIQTNFRCRPGITRWVNGLFGNLFGGGGDGATPYAELIPHRSESGEAVVYLLAAPADRQERVTGEDAPRAFTAIEVPAGEPTGVQGDEPARRASAQALGEREDENEGTGEAKLQGSAEPVEDEPPSEPNAHQARLVEAAIIARSIRRNIESKAWNVSRQKDPDEHPYQNGGRRGSVGENPRERPARYGDVAILLRALSDVSLYEEALQEEGIDCLTSNGKGYFVRPEVAWFGSLLLAIEKPHDEIAVVAALRSPFFGLTDEAILEARMVRGRLDPLLEGQDGCDAGRGDGDAGRGAGDAGREGDDARRALERLGAWHRGRNDEPVGAFVRRILDESSALALCAFGRDGERLSLNLLKIAELARRHETGGGTFGTFVRWLAQGRLDEIDEPDAPLLEAEERAVRIMTIHAAKGLEFPIVVLADLGRQIDKKETFLVDRDAERIAFTMPIRDELRCRSAGYDELLDREKRILRAERRRLLYVACTRAMDRLIVPIVPAKGKPKESFLADLIDGGALPEELADLRRVAAAGAATAAGPAAVAWEVAVAGEAEVTGVAPIGRESTVIEAPAVTGGTQASHTDTVAGAAAMSVAGATSADTITLPNGARVAFEWVPRAEASSPILPIESFEPEGPIEARKTRGMPRPMRETLSEWSAARAERLRVASASPMIVAASGRLQEEEAEEEGLTVASFPGKRGLSDLPGASRSSARIGEFRDAAARRARAFGIAVHSVLEVADLGDPSRLGPLATAAAEAHGIADRAADVESAAKRALSLPTIRRANDRFVLRETPVAFVDEGVLVEGQIDLVYEEDDGSLVVVDFKTDAVDGEAPARARAEEYRPQLGLYARALELATGRTVRETVLLFLTPGLEIRLAHDERSRQAAAATIAQLVQGPTQRLE